MKKKQNEISKVGIDIRNNDLGWYINVVIYVGNENYFHSIGFCPTKECLIGHIRLQPELIVNQIKDWIAHTYVEHYKMKIDLGNGEKINVY